jgi:hypothetical protein
MFCVVNRGATRMACTLGRSFDPFVLGRLTLWTPRKESSMATIRLVFVDEPGTATHSLGNFRIYFSRADLKILRVERNTVGWLQIGDESVGVHVMELFPPHPTESTEIGVPVGHVSSSILLILLNSQRKIVESLEAKMYCTSKSPLELPVAERVVLREVASPVTDFTFYIDSVCRFCILCVKRCVIHVAFGQVNCCSRLSLFAGPADTCCGLSSVCCHVPSIFLLTRMLTCVVSSCCTGRLWG